MNMTPSFYAVIPANVRYANIPANAKLLFAEISALCSREGCCWASDSYLSEFFAGSSAETGNVSTRTIRRWIQCLVDGGFLERVLVYDSHGGLCGRRLYLPGCVPENAVQYPMDKNVQRGGQKCPEIKDNIEKSDRETNLDDGPKENLEKETTGAGARDVLVREENDQSFAAFGLAMAEIREAGANGGMTEDDFGRMLDVLGCLGVDLAARKVVRVGENTIKAADYFKFLITVLIQGEKDVVILKTIRDVCERVLEGKVHNQFAYLSAALWVRLHYSA